MRNYLDINKYFLSQSITHIFKACSGKQYTKKNKDMYLEINHSVTQQRTRGHLVLED